MFLSDFDYDLPSELIAQKPNERRTSSRLMQLDGVSAAIAHRQFVDILELIHPGDLMVFNDTQVIPARLHGEKTSGGKVEVLIERLTSPHTAVVHIGSNKTPKPEALLLMEGGVKLQVEQRQGALFMVRCLNPEPLLELLERHGHMPLPPYVARADNLQDRDRYQTVYARHRGAVAAPTAGLHFDQKLLNQLTARGVNMAYITLHVGAGTFQPVKSEQIEHHQMHAEWLDVSAQVANQITATQAAGKRVIAVGTTSVRALESAAEAGVVKPYSGDTRIFIYPGYRFRVVDALLTNFHLPRSTLLMLISAFAGIAAVREAYRQAVAQKYRFFSYGDAMFISRSAHSKRHLSDHA